MLTAMPAYAIGIFCCFLGRRNVIGLIENRRQRRKLNKLTLIHKFQERWLVRVKRGSH